MSDIDVNLLARIQKLQAKADSLKSMGPAYEAEALTFAAAVQKMLLQYDLDMSEVEYRLDVENNPVKMHLFRPSDFGLTDKKRPILWEYALAVTVANAHSAEILSLEKSNTFVFVGRRHHREVAEYMFVYLSKMVLHLADKAYTKAFYLAKADGDVKTVRGFRASFIEGCVSRIMQRYKEIGQVAVNALSQKGRGVALVRLSNEKALIRKVIDKMQAKGAVELDTSEDPLRQFQKNNKNNLAGFAEGALAGDQINLNANALDNKHQQSAQVAAGQKLIGAVNGAT